MRKILLLLSNGFEALEAAPFTDIFGWNKIIGSKDITLISGGFHNSLNTTFNLKVLPEINLNFEEISLEDFEAIIIPGGFGRAGFFQDIKTDKFKSLIKNFYIKEKYIVGICTGTFALGEANILNNIPATTYLFENKRYFNQLISYGAIPIEKEIVIHNKIITTSAPKTSIDIAFKLLELLTSTENMLKVKKEMGF